MQPKAAVEFDQAINYVNKIKVLKPSSCLLALPTGSSNATDDLMPASPTSVTVDLVIRVLMWKHRYCSSPADGALRVVASADSLRK